MSDSINQRGFTIVELVMSMTLISIMSISIFAIYENYLSTMTRNNLTVDMTVDSQNLLRATVEELRYGAGVRQNNSIADVNAPVGGWNTGNTNFVIIIATPALDPSGNYIIDAATGNPYNNELVYYKSGIYLYKRTLANPSASNNKTTTSCPPASATPICPADKLLIEYVKTMTFNLYDQDDISTINPLIARSIRINLTLERDTFGQPLVLDNSIRVTLRNNFE